MIISKYDSDADVYEYYNFKGNEVTYGKLHLQARTTKHIRKWTHTLDELGWKNHENYVDHLKKLGFKEVTKYHANKRQSKTSALR